MLQEKKFKPRALSVLAQHLGLAKQLGDAAHYRHGLLPRHESVQTHAEMRIGREAARHAQGKSNFLAMGALPRNSRKSNIIDFRICAPRAAAGDGNFELAGQIVEVGISAKL